MRIEDEIVAREKYNLALTKAKKKKYKEARSILEEVINLNPTLIEAYNLLGKVYIRLGKFAKAKKSWLKVLSLEPSNINAVIYLGNLTIRKLYWFLALILTIVIILVFLQAIFFISLNKKAEFHTELLKTKGNESAQPIIDSLNKGLTDLDSSILDLRKDLVTGKGRVKTLKKQVIKKKEPIEDRYEKAVYLFLNTRYEESKKSLMQIPIDNVKKDLKDNILFWIGMCYLKQGKYPDALNEFDKVLKLYPDGNKIPDTKKMKALCLKRMSDHTD
jgi:TolA-binding protein